MRSASRSTVGRFALATAWLLVATGPQVAPPSARAGGGTSRPSLDLDGEMGALAKQIKLLLDQKGQDAIALGEFRAAPKLAASGGPAIAKALADNLEMLGVTIKRRAHSKVQGEYRDVDDKNTRRIALQIRAHVLDEAGAEVASFEPRGVFDPTTIASLAGVTADLPLAADAEARNQKLCDAIDAPKVHLAGNRISAGPGNPYALEILVRAGDEYSPRAATRDEDGFAILKIRNGEPYAVKVINDSPHEAAVSLTIDGLSAFAFSGEPSDRYLLVRAKTNLTVLGWFRSGRIFDAFQVAEYPKRDAADRLLCLSSLRTITATFSAVWPADGSPPADEVGSLSRCGPGLAACWVPGDRPPFPPVQRNIGTLRAAVSVRFDTGPWAEDRIPPGPRP